MEGVGGALGPQSKGDHIRTFVFVEKGKGGTNRTSLMTCTLGEATMDLLTVVRQCHNDDPWNDKELVPLYLTQPPQGAQIGFLSNVVWQTIRNDVRQGTTDAFCFASDGTSVWINPSLQSNQAVSEELKKVVEGWRARDLFPDPLKGKELNPKGEIQIEAEI